MAREIEQDAQSPVIPAPFRGLNTREAFTALQPDEARELENWFPDVGSCRIRPGYTPHVLIAGGYPVKTLARYASGSANVLVGASGGNLYDVSSVTAVALTATTYASDYWSTDQHNGYLFGVNGQDTPWMFQGTTVSATGFTGPTLTTLRTVKSVHNRLWFTINNSADVYYGGIMSITGALTQFQLSQIADGGKCLAVYPWHNNTVFVMSTGEVIIYSGDPATDFAIVDKYQAPILVEADAAVKMGGELVLLTSSGPISMDIVTAGLGFNLDALGNWGKISPAWRSDYAIYGANTGWFGKFIDGVMYLNVPIGSGVSKQYVYNTRNQSWTTYASLPIASIEYLNGVTYFGSVVDGNVYSHGTGSDNGAQIMATGRPGFSFLGDSAHAKQFVQIRPNIIFDGAASGQFQVDIDFKSSNITAPVVSLSTATGSTPWGSSWGSVWASSATSNPRWHAVRGYGRAVSPVIRVMSTSDNTWWFSTDVLSIQGAQL